MFQWLQNGIRALGIVLLRLGGGQTYPGGPLTGVVGDDGELMDITEKPKRTARFAGLAGLYGNVQRFLALDGGGASTPQELDERYDRFVEDFLNAFPVPAAYVDRESHPRFSTIMDERLLLPLAMAFAHMLYATLEVEHVPLRDHDGNWLKDIEAFAKESASLLAGGEPARFLNDMTFYLHRRGAVGGINPREQEYFVATSDALLQTLEDALATPRLFTPETLALEHLLWRMAGEFTHAGEKIAKAQHKGNAAWALDLPLEKERFLAGYATGAIVLVLKLTRGETVDSADSALHKELLETLHSIGAAFQEGGNVWIGHQSTPVIERIAACLLGMSAERKHGGKAEIETYTPRIPLSEDEKTWIAALRHSDPVSLTRMLHAAWEKAHAMDRDTTRLEAPGREDNNNREDSDNRERHQRHR